MEGTVAIMAFDSLPGMKLTVTRTQQTFIIGDYLAVYYADNDTPDVYEWRNVTKYIEMPDGFTISMGDLDFVFPKNIFADAEQIVTFRAMVEGQIPRGAGTEKRTTPRIVPPKYNYRNSDLTGSTFSAASTYVERDINTGALAYAFSRNSIFIWFIAVAAGCGMFGLLSAMVGSLEENLIFFIIISFFTMVGVAVIIFLIFCTVAKHRYSHFVKTDVSAVMNIVFVVAQEGFAGIEQCIYTGNELIPWHLAKNFYETKYSIIINCADRSCLRIPKRLFNKSTLHELTDFITARVEQD